MLMTSLNFSVLFPWLTPLMTMLGLRVSTLDKSSVKFVSSVVDQAIKERKMGEQVRDIWYTCPLLLA